MENGTTSMVKLYVYMYVLHCSLDRGNEHKYHTLVYIVTGQSDCWDKRDKRQQAGVWADERQQQHRPMVQHFSPRQPQLTVMTEEHGTTHSPSHIAVCNNQLHSFFLYCLSLFNICNESQSEFNLKKCPWSARGQWQTVALVGFIELLPRWCR